MWISIVTAQPNPNLFKSITVHVFASYVHMRARIMMKINILVDRYTDSLSLKFYEDPSIGCGEIAKTKALIHILNVLLQPNLTTT